RAEAGSNASAPSTSAAWWPEAVVLAIKARSKLVPPEDRGPTISLSRPAGKAPSKRSVPRGSHPGGGEDSMELIMASLGASEHITRHVFSISKQQDTVAS